MKRIILVGAAFSLGGAVEAQTVMRSGDVSLPETQARGTFISGQPSRALDVHDFVLADEATLAFRLDAAAYRRPDGSGFSLTQVLIVDGARPLPTIIRSSDVLATTFVGVGTTRSFASASALVRDGRYRVVVTPAFSPASGTYGFTLFGVEPDPAPVEEADGMEVVVILVPLPDTDRAIATLSVAHRRALPSRRRLRHRPLGQQRSRELRRPRRGPASSGRPGPRLQPGRGRPAPVSSAPSTDGSS